MEIDWPPAYILKRNKRARRVSFKINPYHGLECVVPQRFNEAELPFLLDSQRSWIEKHLSARKPIEDTLPDQIKLKAIDQTWQVSYIKAEGKLRMLHRPMQALVVMGDVTDRKKCRALLVDWIKAQAKEVIGPWLVAVSRETGLSYEDVSIRGQKTRWGSCSSKRVINLNYKLIFLPPELVRYVLIHELCHTIQMNHSKAFWNLVEKYDISWQHHDNSLPAAEQLVPLWINQL